ncbi:MAG: transposase zinc-binding domain-containing protein, partial [Rubrivivax sp.]|nr:transposase zinc-binding domain-containing protein [Rubrivivax sp.]
PERAAQLRPAALVELRAAEAAAGAACRTTRKDEFVAFLECGILAHGFLRLRCGDCGHDKLVAFSCRRRSDCPSCGARRMVQTAGYLVDRIIPPRAGAPVGAPFHRPPQRDRMTTLSFGKTMVTERPDAGCLKVKRCPPCQVASMASPGRVPVRPWRPSTAALTTWPVTAWPIGNVTWPSGASKPTPV